MSNPLWDKEVVCKFCAGEFKTTRLRSSAIRIVEKHSDFCNVYEGHNAYYYAITACPHCTVAFRNEEWEKVLSQYEPKVSAASRKLKESAHKPDIFELGEMDALRAVKRHELAIAFNNLRKHPDLGELAGLWLHVAWIWRGTGDADKEKAAMLHAAESYEQFFEKGGKLPDKLGEPGVMFLIGDLLRRCGELQKARSYFSRALTSKELGAFPNIEHVLRDSMLSIKTEIEAQKGL